MSPTAAVGIHSSEIKQRNVSAILLNLLKYGSISRVLLAQEIGVSSATITNLVAELVEQGLIAEDSRAQSALRANGAPNQVGRPQRLLTLIPDARYSAGIHIDVGKLHVAFTDVCGKLVACQSLDHQVDMDWHAVLDQACEALAALQTTHRLDAERVVGVGVAASGLVDPTTGINVIAPNLDWHNVPIGDYVGAKLGLPVVVENNARAMALGEAMFGSGRDIRAMAFVYARIGVGAGLVVNGQIYRGADAGAGEIGHSHLMFVTGDTTEIRSLESIISRPALLRSAQSVLQQDDPLTLEDLIDRAIAGDEALLAMLEERAFYFGVVLANLVNLFNPELIVLGGLFLSERGLLLPTIEKTMRQYAFATLGKRVRLETTGLGAQVGMIGAAALALDRFFYRPHNQILVKG
ncbi:MAG: ROK family transcriptional regulator [Anaerolineae bacterium]|nr:ROK family transcriptional regulator [Anaerolineae bacterium]